MFQSSMRARSLLLLLLLATFSFMTSAEAASRADVKAIQAMLNDMGYTAGPADGAAGRKTRAAIRAYQRDHGLLADGRASPELREHLQGTLAGRSAKQAAPAASPSKSAKPTAAFKRKSRRKTGPAKQPTRAASTKSTPAQAAASARTTRPATPQKSLGKAVALRNGTLHRLPSTRTDTTARFTSGTRFDIRARSGIWMDVVSEDGASKGWARLGAVRLVSSARNTRQSSAATSRVTPRQQNEGSGFQSLSRTLSGWLGGGSSSSSSRNQPTATLGIRGLTRNQLSGQGRPDMAALAHLDRIARPGGARSFASRAGLRAQNVAYPRVQAAASTNGGNTFDNDARD